MIVKFSPKSANKQKESPPEPTRSEIIAGLKKILSYGIYEDSDYEVTEDYIRVDLAYDTKGTVDSYQERLRSRYPGRVSVDGTITTIDFKARRTNDTEQNK
ncbi:MAG: hypothetical protein GF334_02930 [Candidatus Altiarchaeales archaeon]|nr:hypothetical protein [Candidatus Altiarchaeales archaeon]